MATLRDVFAHVAVLGPPGRFDGSGGGNTIVLASDAPIPAAAIARPQRGAGRRRRARRRPGRVVDLIGDAPVLTDEHAPVDQLLT